jgi:hypothetical protein
VDFCGGDSTWSIDWKAIFPKEWDYDLSLPVLAIEVSISSTFFKTILSFGLMKGIGSRYNLNGD